MNYFFLGDSPTLETGFAQVTKNIIPHLELGGPKHMWALGYYGEPHQYPVHLYPANVNASWESNRNVNHFFDWINSFNGPKTLWTLHDPFRLRKFRDGLIDLKRRGVRIVSYIPVDSPLDPEDIAFLELVDDLVAYTEYGAREIKKLLPDRNVLVVPHGYDPFFGEMGSDLIKEFRANFFPFAEDKFLIGCVNSNTQRKALHRSLQILRELGDEYRMYIHADPKGFYPIKKLAYQLGVSDKVMFADPFFEGEGVRNGLNRCDKNMLAALYNSFDIFLSTTYGEGWGLTVGEAMCCGVPTAIPQNTVFPEIYREESAIWLPNSNSTFSMGKIVDDIDPKESAEIINREVEGGLSNVNLESAKEDVQINNWEIIVKQWNQII